MTTVRETLTPVGRNLWLASLGALASVGGEARDLVDDLVVRGARYEKRRIRPMENNVDRMARRVITFGDQMGEKLGNQFEDAVKSAAHRLGMPTHEDFERLSERLTALGEKLDRAAKTAAE